jgi:hypothetical protein
MYSYPPQANPNGNVYPHKSFKPPRMLLDLVHTLLHVAAHNMVAREAPTRADPPPVAEVPRPHVLTPANTPKIRLLCHEMRTALGVGRQARPSHLRRCTVAQEASSLRRATRHADGVSLMTVRVGALLGCMALAYRPHGVGVGRTPHNMHVRLRHCRNNNHITTHSNRPRLVCPTPFRALSNIHQWGQRTITNRLPFLQWARRGTVRPHL